MPAASTPSRIPQRRSRATPGTWTWWVESVSLGKRRAVDGEDLQAAAREEQCRRGAGDAGPDHDDVVHGL